jgi:hypothetical protein
MKEKRCEAKGRGRRRVMREVAPVSPSLVHVDEEHDVVAEHANAVSGGEVRGLG